MKPYQSGPVTMPRPYAQIGLVCTGDCLFRPSATISNLPDRLDDYELTMILFFFPGKKILEIHTQKVLKPHCTKTASAPPPTTYITPFNSTRVNQPVPFWIVH